MTKMQIIAKAVITFLGLSAFVNLSQNFRTMTSLSQTQDASVLRDILLSLLVTILLIATVYWLILKNDWLVRKISGSGEKLVNNLEIILFLVVTCAFETTFPSLIFFTIFVLIKKP